MDKFRLINDQLGLRNGDLVLLEVVKRIQGIVAGFASLFRTNGDEFGIIIRGTNSRDFMQSLLQRLQRVISMPISLDGKTVFPSSSFGVVLDIPGTSSGERILSQLVDAILTGKRRGIGNITFYAPEEDADPSASKHRYNLLTARANIEKALSMSEFVPYFQPIYQLTPLRLAGFETLARWNHPEQGMMAPADFVPQAEETGLIIDIDKYIIRQAMLTLSKWIERTPEMPLFISANASGASFSSPDFTLFVQNQLQEISLAPHRFVLEVTEGIMLEKPEDTKTQLNRLREMGVKIALDDFGTGYSSLQYVNRLPIDYIKIDKSFIAQLFQGEKNTLMVRSIINMACALGLNIVAEGVENEDQAQWLSANCPPERIKGQGYFFSCPVSLSEAQSLLEDAMAFQGLS